MQAAARSSLAGRFRWQADGCKWLGSPLYAALCRRAADDIEAAGPVLDVLVGHEDDPLSSMLQLRLLGAVHRLVLRGEAPALAACYPSTGGQATDDETWRAFRETVGEQRSRIRELIALPVQTNEVGRSRALSLGFAEAARRTSLPLRVLEVGASGGLNLRWDRFHYASGEFVFGDPDSPVRLRDFHEGEAPPPAPPGLEVVERAGCDRHPVDASTVSGCETLRAYLWPDQRSASRRWKARSRSPKGWRWTSTRPQRCRGCGTAWPSRRRACAPSCSTRSSCSTSTTGSEPRSTGLFAEVGERATPQAPLARLSFESEQLHVALRLSVWPGGRQTLLAECRHHGAPVRWLGGDA